MELGGAERVIAKKSRSLTTSLERNRDLQCHPGAASGRGWKDFIACSVAISRRLLAVTFFILASTDFFPSSEKYLDNCLLITAEFYHAQRHSIECGLAALVRPNFYISNPGREFGSEDFITHRRSIVRKGLAGSTGVHRGFPPSLPRKRFSDLRRADFRWRGEPMVQPSCGLPRFLGLSTQSQCSRKQSAH